MISTKSTKVTFDASAPISSNESEFKTSLQAMSSAYQSLAGVMQAHLMVALLNMDKGNNSTLVSMCLNAAGVTKGIALAKVEQYVVDHLTGAKVMKKTDKLGIISYTIKKDKESELAFGVKIPTVTWVEYSREKKDTVTKTVEQEIESLAKVLAGKKLTDDEIERAVSMGKVIRMAKVKAEQAKAQAKISMSATSSIEDKRAALLAQLALLDGDTVAA